MLFLTNQRPSYDIAIYAQDSTKSGPGFTGWITVQNLFDMTSGLAWMQPPYGEGTPSTNREATQRIADNNRCLAFEVGAIVAVAKKGVGRRFHRSDDSVVPFT